MSVESHTPSPLGLNPSLSTQPDTSKEVKYLGQGAFKLPNGDVRYATKLDLGDGRVWKHGETLTPEVQNIILHMLQEAYAGIEKQMDAAKDSATMTISARPGGQKSDVVFTYPATNLANPRTEQHAFTYNKYDQLEVLFAKAINQGNEQEMKEGGGIHGQSLSQSTSLHSSAHPITSNISRIAENTLVLSNQPPHLAPQVENKRRAAQTPLPKRSIQHQTSPSYCQRFWKAFRGAFGKLTPKELSEDFQTTIKEKNKLKNEILTTLNREWHDGTAKDPLSGEDLILKVKDVIEKIRTNLSKGIIKDKDSKFTNAERMEQLASTKFWNFPKGAKDQIEKFQVLAEKLKSYEKNIAHLINLEKKLNQHRNLATTKINQSKIEYDQIETRRNLSLESLKKLDLQSWRSLIKFEPINPGNTTTKQAMLKQQNGYISARLQDIQGSMRKKESDKSHLELIRGELRDLLSANNQQLANISRKNNNLKILADLALPAKRKSRRAQ